jgi:hypothetical protein
MALGRKPGLYFWRSHDGLEVDLLIVINGCPMATSRCHGMPFRNGCALACRPSSSLVHLFPFGDFQVKMQFLIEIPEK